MTCGRQEGQGRMDDITSKGHYHTAVALSTASCFLTTTAKERLMANFFMTIPPVLFNMTHTNVKTHKTRLSELKSDSQLTPKARSTHMCVDRVFCSQCGLNGQLHGITTFFRFCGKIFNICFQKCLGKI